MAATKQPIQQINPQSHDSRFDDLRKELSPKIDEKLSERSFFSILGVIIIIMLTVFGYFAYQISEIKDKFDGLKTEVTVLKIKMEEVKK